MGKSMTSLKAAKVRTELMEGRRILLRIRGHELEERCKVLEEENTALKVLFKKKQQEKIEFEDKILFCVENLIMPNLQDLKGAADVKTIKNRIDIIESNLTEIISPFHSYLFPKLLRLSPTEIKVANLVRQGKTTREIAELFKQSTKTIDFYRDNIRKKLKINNSKISLKTYLTFLK